MPYVTPTTRSTGDLITAAIWNQDVVDNQTAAFPLGVGAWTTYTPDLEQNNVAVTKTVTRATYMRVGRTVWVHVQLAVTGTGTAAQRIDVGLPVTAAFGSNACIGSGYLFDTSATTNYPFVVLVLAGGTQVAFLPTSTDQANFLGSGVFTAALASGDNITFTATYEAAT